VETVTTPWTPQIFSQTDLETTWEYEPSSLSQATYLQ
jgi:hypothetical protein